MNMKLALIVSVLMLPGCAALRGTMFDGTVCTFQSSEAARASVSTVMDALPEGKDKNNAKMVLAIADISATAACEARRALEAKQAPAEK